MTKVPCLPLRVGAIPSPFRYAKEPPVDFNNIIPWTLRREKLQIRLTEEELSRIKEYLINYCSMIHYIRSAIKEYSDPSEIQRLQLIEAPDRFYRNNRNDLSTVSVNINNAVKRANELAIFGHLIQTIFTETLLPQIIHTRIFLEYLTC